MKRIAVFASGSGSNAENLIRHFAERQDKGRVELIVSNRSNAGVLERAARLGVPAVIISKDDMQNEAKMLRLLGQYGIDVIVLAGFLMMIPPYLTRKFAGRMLNIHPSLLPAYGGKGMYGRYVHEAVIAAGEKESGITVHTVTEICDDGEIIYQTRIPVDPSDTPESLEEKIHDLEREHFPRVVEEFIQ